VNAVPRSIRRIQERVSQRDREWFEKRPDTDVRHRAYIPGEFGPISYADLYGEFAARVREFSPNPRVHEMVEVTQLAPGIRNQRPYVALERRGEERTV
jgi:hypothetical protein